MEMQSKHNFLSPEREHYVTDNMTLVHYVAQKNLHISPSAPYYEDCIQEGNYGLILSAERFDESSGNSFSAYAISYIRGYILHFIREFVNSSIRLPRRYLDSFSMFHSLTAKECTQDEISEALGLSGKDIAELQNIMSMTSLNAPAGSVSNEYDMELHEVIGKEDPGFADFLSDDYIELCIKRVSEVYLKENEKGVWFDYIYQTLFGEKTTQDTLAEKYQLSQAQISRILTKGKLLLKQYLEEAESITHHLDSDES